MHTSSTMLHILSQHSVFQLTADLTQSPESGAHSGRMTCSWGTLVWATAARGRHAQVCWRGHGEAWLSPPGLRAHHPARARVHTCTRTHTLHTDTRTLTGTLQGARAHPQPTRKAASPCGCPPAHRPRAGPSCPPHWGWTCTCCSRCWVGPLRC